jgi:hypothetical protein
MFKEFYNAHMKAYARRQRVRIVCHNKVADIPY